MPWPGVKNAEFETIERIKIACKNINIQCLVINNDGFLLDDDQLLTTNLVNPKELEFTLSLHYCTTKILDCFFYGILWNPPTYMIEQDHYMDIITNYSSYDDLIGYNSKPMLNHAKLMVDGFPINVNEDVFLTASLPKTATVEPNLNNEYKAFYCGINWELCTGKPGRHNKLLKGLEEDDDLKIFGPKKFLHIEPWKGFRSYSGSIPFDGISITKEISKCGIALVLCSDDHRKYNVVTNRIYESAAAGAIVIADKNQFIEDNFGDSVLTIDYSSGDQEDALTQIREKILWIKNNKKEALEKAQKLQKIFLDKFALEKQLKNIIDGHKKRKEEIYKNIHSKNNNETVTVILSINECYENFNDKTFITTIDQINNQLYQNLSLIITCDTSLLEKISKIISSNLNSNIKWEIYDFKIFSGEKRLMLSGEVLSNIRNNITSDYITFISEKTIWFSDHITSLKRVLEKNDSIKMSHSGSFVKEFIDDSKFMHHILCFQELLPSKLKLFDDRINISSTMIRKEVINKYADALKFIDNMEFYLFSILCSNRKSLKFSRRMTSGVVLKKSELMIPQFMIEESIQINFIYSLFRNDAENFESYTLSTKNCNHLLIEFKNKLKEKYKKGLLFKVLIRLVMGSELKKLIKKLIKQTP